MNELFALPETKSPKQRWLEKYQIQTTLRPDEPNADLKWLCESKHPATQEVFAFGSTADDAVVQWAIKAGVKLWNEEVFRL